MRSKKPEWQVWQRIFFDYFSGFDQEISEKQEETGFRSFDLRLPRRRRWSRGPGTCRRTWRSPLGPRPRSCRTWRWSGSCGWRWRPANGAPPASESWPTEKESLVSAVWQPSSLLVRIPAGSCRRGNLERARHEKITKQQKWSLFLRPVWAKQTGCEVSARWSVTDVGEGDLGSIPSPGRRCRRRSRQKTSEFKSTTEHFLRDLLETSQRKVVAGDNLVPDARLKFRKKFHQRHSNKP